MALIYISVGSNIERERHISAAYLELSALFGQIYCSAVYESEAVGFDGDAFYNLVVRAHTELSVADCVAAFKAIEQKYGRIANSPKLEGKKLDLDLLTYDQLICAEPVVLPREEISKNAFVLLPLSELAPQTVHPLTGFTYQQMWQHYREPQKLWRISFDWPQPAATVALPPL
jgi:2-amino-4-hydroxy-6-hydroxymethyldihydropteridine diphosphokinase